MATTIFNALLPIVITPSTLFLSNFLSLPTMGAFIWLLGG